MDLIPAEGASPAGRSGPSPGLSQCVQFDLVLSTGYTNCGLHEDLVELRSAFSPYPETRGCTGRDKKPADPG